jgi:hypothetical protein
MLTGKKKNANSDPSLSGATSTISIETTMCAINKNQVDLISILAINDLFVVGKMEITIKRPTRVKGIKYFAEL